MLGSGNPANFTVMVWTPATRGKAYRLAKKLSGHIKLDDKIVAGMAQTTAWAGHTRLVRSKIRNLLPVCFCEIAIHDRSVLLSIQTSMQAQKVDQLLQQIHSIFAVFPRPRDPVCDSLWHTPKPPVPLLLPGCPCNS